MLRPNKIHLILIVATYIMAHHEYTLLLVGGLVGWHLMNGTFSLVGHRTYTNVPKQNFMNSFRFSREKVEIITCESRVQHFKKSGKEGLKGESSDNC